MNCSSPTGTVVSSIEDPVGVERAPGIVELWQYARSVPFQSFKVWSFTVTTAVSNSGSELNLLETPP